MKKEFPITLSQLKTIYDVDWDLFVEEIVPNCFCSNCPGVVSIVNYSIVVNDLNDIILMGHCSVCGDRVNRYIETGEHEYYVRRIKKVKKEMKK